MTTDETMRQMLRAAFAPNEYDPAAEFWDGMEHLNNSHCSLPLEPILRAVLATQPRGKLEPALKRARAEAQEIAASLDWMLRELEHGPRLVPPPDAPGGAQ